ncbi:MAG: hypothetical protein IPM47_11535 [Sphingobacteriales bacterium]|nr:MAG: hypothetical protein IPM47_11535 [Sphingobacteriales bacterium]
MYGSFFIALFLFTTRIFNKLEEFDCHISDVESHLLNADRTNAAGQLRRKKHSDRNAQKDNPEAKATQIPYSNQKTKGTAKDSEDNLFLNILQKAILHH